MPLRETRRILLDGNTVDVVRHGDTLVAGDGREVCEVRHRPSLRDKGSAGPQRRAARRRGFDGA